MINNKKLNQNFINLLKRIAMYDDLSIHKNMMAPPHGVHGGQKTRIMVPLLKQSLMRKYNGCSFEPLK